jgi:hypothetical protein
LGAQGTGPLGFHGGSTTDSMTMGMTALLPEGFAVMGSATFARTQGTTFERSPLSIADDGLLSTAWQVTAMKTGLFDDADKMRISFAQPLQVESGVLEFRSLQIVDRDTGELGPVTQRWQLGGSRAYRAEAIYALPVLEGQAEVSGFALLELNRSPLDGPQNAVSVGAQFRITL